MLLGQGSVTELLISAMQCEHGAVHDMSKSELHTVAVVAVVSLAGLHLHCHHQRIMLKGF